MTPSYARRLVGAVVFSNLAQVAAARPASADVPGVGIVTDAIGGATGWAFDKVADGITSWVLGAVGFFVDGAVGLLRSSAGPTVQADWFAGPGSPFATVRNLAAVLLVGFVFLGLIQGLLRGDPGSMVRQLAGKLPLAVAGMVVTTSVVGYLVALTDALSAAVLATTDNQALHFLSGFGAAATGLTGGFAAVVIGLVAVVAALLLWVELVVRSSLTYLLVAVTPLGFAAMLWPAARGVLRRTVELLVAVVLSKFVVCVALAIGVAALSGAGTAGTPDTSVAGAAGAGLGSLLVGTVLLGLAAFSPFLVLKLIPLAEAAVVAQGASRGPLRAAQSGLGTYSSIQMAGRLSGGSPGRSGGVAGAFPLGPHGSAGGNAGPPGATGGAGTAAAAGAVAGVGAGAGAGSGTAGFSTAGGEHVQGSAGSHGSTGRGPERMEPPPPRLDKREPNKERPQ